MRAHPAVRRAPALAFVLAALAASAVAQVQTFENAFMDGTQVKPNPTPSPGIGLATLELEPAKLELSWIVAYEGLIANELAVHFHGPVNAQGIAPVVMTLAGVGSPKAGRAKLTAQQMADLQAGKWYVDVHTQNFPAGEIRGNITAKILVWVNLESSKPGTANKTPRLVGTGTLKANSANKVVLTNAKANAQGILFVGLKAINKPLKGGLLVPDPQFSVPFVTNAQGRFELAFHWPPGVPANTNLYWHAWIKDPGATKGASASNALKSTSQ